MTSPFNLPKLIDDVFGPSAGERVLILIDQPHDACPDHDSWRERRAMAADWHDVFRQFPVELAPLTSYPATGANNGDLPSSADQEGKNVDLLEEILRSQIVIAMTQYSATAPLSKLVRQADNLRVASMPGVLRRMEQTALRADYAEVARKTHILAEKLTAADRADVVFSNGDELTFDLRYRTGHADDGICRAGKAHPLINLPSGEAFIVPYEGERDGEPSRTQGRIPYQKNSENMVLEVEANRIIHVHGEGPEANAFRQYLDTDAARRNVAELGLGCNDQAVVMGSVIEDEKAGMHWAFGRSEHLGGVVGPDAFARPENVVHQDIVYTTGCPFGIRSLTLHYPDREPETIMRDNVYQID